MKKYDEVMKECDEVLIKQLLRHAHDTCENCFLLLRVHGIQDREKMRLILVVLEYFQSALIQTQGCIMLLNNDCDK